MILERLRIFVAVAEREHVTRAAQSLHLTQSAVSNAIAALEGEHDVKLFDRIGRGVALNAAGQAFLPEARAVLARAAAAEAALADLGGLRRGRLTLWASQTIAGYWLPERLVAFHQAYPGVTLEVSVGNSREVADAVLDGAAEIGLIEGEIDEPLLDEAIVGADRLAVLITPDHAWAQIKRLRAEALLDQPWVLRELGSGTRSSFETALRDAGAAPELLNVVMTLPSNEAVLTAALAGAGATALSQSVAEAAIASGRLKRAAFDLPERPFRLLRHRARYRSRAGEAFVDQLNV
jgi:DNA-binding transcriptional LysR family regulator